MDLSRRVVARYLAAYIQMPPRNLKTYVENLHKVVSRGAARVKAIYEKYERERDDINGYNYVMRGLQGDYDFDNFEYLARQLADLAHTIDVFRPSQYTGPARLVEHLKRDMEGYHRMVEFSKQSPSAIEEAAHDTAFPPEYVALYNEVLGIVKDVVSRVQAAIVAIQALVDQSAAISGFWEPEKATKGPHTEKIEKLFHASIHARKLYEHGFSPTRPDENGGMGLGGSVEDKAGNKAISFTFDPKYAFEIARWFKEMAMVVRGEITVGKIVEWAKHEGVLDKVFQRFKELYAGTVETGKYPFKEFTTLEKKDGHWGVFKTHWDREKQQNVEEPGDPDLFFGTKDGVYKLYFCLITEDPHRENPVAMETQTLLERMERENVDPRDIGVLTAEIDMEDPDIAYVPGEREYRVPPRAIKKIVAFR